MSNQEQNQSSSGAIIIFVCVHTQNGTTHPRHHTESRRENRNLGIEVSDSKHERQTFALLGAIFEFGRSLYGDKLEIRIRSVSLAHVHSVGVVWYAWK